MSVGRMMAVTRLEGLTATQKSVLFVLADFEDDSTGMCMTTMGTLAHFAGCGVRTAFRIVRELETIGFLTRKSRQKSDCGTATSYVFCFNKLGVSYCQFGSM